MEEQRYSIKQGHGHAHTHTQYLHEGVRRVVHKHDKCPSADVIHQPWEADEEYGGHMVNDLLFEILQRSGQHTASTTITNKRQKKKLFLRHLLISAVEFSLAGRTPWQMINALQEAVNTKAF